MRSTIDAVVGGMLVMATLWTVLWICGGGM